MNIKLISKINQFKKLDIGGIIFYTLFRVKKELKILIFNRMIHCICHLKGVKLGRNIIFSGNPIIRRYPKSSIIFGDGCKFNSAKNSVSIGLNQPCTFVTVGENSEIIIGANSGVTGLKMHARSKISIGNNVLIGSGCTIIDNDAHHSDFRKRDFNTIPSRPIYIEDNVFIGMQCVILKGVTIGKNSVIGANSIVFNSIPENSIAIGNPCKVIIKKMI